MNNSFRPTVKIVKDLDNRKFLELRRRAQLNDVTVKVGLPTGKKHKERDKLTGKFKRITKKTGALLLALIGAVHEFGAPEKGIPARPWLRPGILSGKPDYVRLNRVNLVRILRGQITRDDALKQLGNMAVGKVKEYIRRGEHFKPLKAATIKRKGSSAPLIDTGQMMNSVTFQLTSAKGDKELKK